MGQLYYARDVVKALQTITGGRLPERMGDLPPGQCNKGAVAGYRNIYF